MTAPRPLTDHAGDSENAARRRMWAAVVMTAFNDWWARLDRAHGNRACIARIHADALRWAGTAWGRMVLDMAEVSVDPEQVAAAAVDPEAYQRTIRLRDGRADA